MPFGLFNALYSFQDYINKILAKKLDIFVIVYVNNIFIYTKDQSPTHINTVWLVLKKPRKKSVFANLKKCQFHKSKVPFESYVILAQEVQMKDKRIGVIKDWPKPKSVRDIQVFFGFANFYCHFI